MNDADYPTSAKLGQWYESPIPQKIKYYNQNIFFRKGSSRIAKAAFSPKEDYSLIIKYILAKHVSSPGIPEGNEEFPAYANLVNLQHENLIRYLGAGVPIRADGTPFVPIVPIKGIIFQEYFSERTLGQIIREDQLKHECIPSICWQLLEGLHYLHSCTVPGAIIHADIKSDNIICRRENNDWHVKIADMDGHLCLTSEQLVIGTAPRSSAAVSHVSPELWLIHVEPHNNHLVGTETDIWSFGCVVSEMLGSEYFSVGRGTNWPAWFRWGQLVRNADLPEKNFIREDLNTGMKDFLQHCFARERGNRATASQLLQHSFISNHCNKIKLVESSL